MQRWITRLALIGQVRRVEHPAPAVRRVCAYRPRGQSPRRATDRAAPPARCRPGRRPSRVRKVRRRIAVCQGVGWNARFMGPCLASISGDRLMKVQHHAADGRPGGQLGLRSTAVFRGAWPTWRSCSASDGWPRKKSRWPFRNVGQGSPLCRHWASGQETVRRAARCGRRRNHSRSFRSDLGQHARRLDEGRVVEQREGLLRRVGDVAGGRAFLAGWGVEVGQHRVEEGALPVHVDAAAILAVVAIGDRSRDRGTGGSRSTPPADTGRRSGRRCPG